jgi:hypothetical protein
MTFEDPIRSLADAVGRALGSVLNQMKICEDLGPVMDHAAGVVTMFKTEQSAASWCAQTDSKPGPQWRYGLVTMCG